MSHPAPLDIYLVEVPLNRSSDFRPVVVVNVVDDEHANVVPISSAIDLYRPSQHFLIDKREIDFAATGPEMFQLCGDGDSQACALEVIQEAHWRI